MSQSGGESCNYLRLEDRLLMDNLISIVIPTYNRIKDLSRCLELIRMQDVQQWEIELIIVDDGSSDGTEGMMKEIQQEGCLNLKYIRQNNQGPAVARNIGIREAMGVIIVFIDDDSFVQPGWLTELLKPFSVGDSKIAGVRGEVISDNDDPSSLSAELGKYIYASKPRTSATNNMAYRKDVLLEVGLFDERFKYAAGEDTDLGSRVKDLGYQIAFAPEAVVRHPHENSWDIFRRKSIVRGMGAAIYFKKWIFKYPPRSLNVFRPLKAWCYIPLLIFSPDVFSGGWRGAYILAYHKRFVLQGFLRELFLSQTK